jgi:hypothetical protein
VLEPVAVEMRQQRSVLTDDELMRAQQAARERPLLEARPVEPAPGGARRSPASSMTTTLPSTPGIRGAV